MDYHAPIDPRSPKVNAPVLSQFLVKKVSFQTINPTMELSSAWATREPRRLSLLKGEAEGKAAEAAVCVCGLCVVGSVSATLNF
jgi:hypothetical protein